MSDQYTDLAPNEWSVEVRKPGLNIVRCGRGCDGFKTDLHWIAECAGTWRHKYGGYVVPDSKLYPLGMAMHTIKANRIA